MRRKKRTTSIERGLDEDELILRSSSYGNVGVDVRYCKVMLVTVRDLGYST